MLHQRLTYLCSDLVSKGLQLPTCIIESMLEAWLVSLRMREGAHEHLSIGPHPWRCHIEDVMTNPSQLHLFGSHQLLCEGRDQRCPAPFHAWRLDGDGSSTSSLAWTRESPGEAWAENRDRQVIADGFFSHRKHPWGFGQDIERED
jgi:hypothetical protein